MLTRYLSAAMAGARYEILSDGEFYGEIPGLSGVWANASTLDGCRAELADVLEGWIILGLALGHRIPPVAGVAIEAPAVA